MKDTNCGKKSQFILESNKGTNGTEPKSIYICLIVNANGCLMFFPLCIWLSYRITVVGAQPGITGAATAGSKDLDTVWVLESDLTVKKAGLPGRGFIRELPPDNHQIVEKLNLVITGGYAQWQGEQ